MYGGIMLNFAVHHQQQSCCADHVLLACILTSSGLMPAPEPQSMQSYSDLIIQDQQPC